MEFFRTAQEAVTHGYRACKLCRPLQVPGETPAWVKSILRAVERQESARLSDAAIGELGVDPNRLRRWFKKNHQMSFQAYLRARRLGRAFGHLTQGGKVIDTAFSHGYDSLSGFTDAFKKLTGRAPGKSADSMVIYVHQLATPLGPMLAAAVDEGICLLEFCDRRMLERNLVTLQKRFRAPLVTAKHRHITQLKRELKEYFAGRRQSFSIPLAFGGTAFQNKVWSVLQAIPYGKTRSYKEQAAAIGHPRAVRAVARANGDNRIYILVPCHRVIGSNGKLVGYGGGLERKQYLLDLEQKHAALTP